MIGQEFEVATYRTMMNCMLCSVYNDSQSIIALQHEATELVEWPSDVLSFLRKSTCETTL